MIQRIRTVINADSEIIPPELRSEFRREISFTNISRMKLVGLVVFAANAVFIIAIDSLNLLNLEPTPRLIAFFLHLTLCIAGLIPVYLNRRYKSLSVQAMEPFHYYLSTFMPTAFLVFPTILLYVIALNGGNPVGPYCAVLTLWGAGLMLNFQYAVRVVLSNNLLFLATMWYASTQTSINFGLEGFLSAELLTIALLIGMSLNFRKNAQEFVQRKQIEFDRNRIAMLNEEIAAAYEEAEALNNNLTTTLRALENEQRTSERLLLNVLPEPIANRMKAGETSIAEHFEKVTVLFADIVGFTKLSASMNPEELVSLLDRMFSAFDALAEKHGIEKIKTIGDAYMAVCGVPLSADRHVEKIANFAFDMLTTLEVFNSETQNILNIRIGIHTGEVVAGVIGKHKFSYDLWGDTVNTASRMEFHGEPGKIHISEDVYRILQPTSAALLHPEFYFSPPQEIAVKGKGTMTTYFLSRR
ncbi:MAG: adenylate/guanylate cyclase domain-containing protein [Candidatus Kapabacteria bacterium]|jgi:class 3 adenylate cyclase|nr:adenylate/guanylate cyclase domain-containing protein [Candidatus Kapabacteria bacterium]